MSWSVECNREFFTVRDSNERHARHVFAMCIESGIDASLYCGTRLVSCWNTKDGKCWPERADCARDFKEV